TGPRWCGPAHSPVSPLIPRELPMSWTPTVACGCRQRLRCGPCPTSRCCSRHGRLHDPGFAAWRAPGAGGRVWRGRGQLSQRVHLPVAVVEVGGIAAVRLPDLQTDVGVVRKHSDRHLPRAPWAMPDVSDGDWPAVSDRRGVDGDHVRGGLVVLWAERAAGVAAHLRVA